MHNFRELKIWQRSMDFVVAVYGITANFPRNEQFGLISQLRRSAVSIPSNIAEGAGRATRPQFRQFLEVAMGSVNEVQTQLELAYRIGFIECGTFEQMAEEAKQIYKMILGFHNTLI